MTSIHSACFVACFCVFFSASNTDAPLRQAALHSKLLIGTAVRPSLLAEPAYSAALAREFNMVEPEDAMKWWTVRPMENSFDFTQADQVVRYAQAHAMQVRGHCLVWDHDNPKWLTEGHYTPTQLSALLHEHIAKEVKHYAGQVFAWDVVNEAFAENGRLKDSIWYNKPGIGMADQGSAYVEQAFRWAREADPQALLFYNDNGGEGLGPKSDAIYAMLKDFKKRGVPIDGVGLQMHIDQLNFDSGAVGKNMSRLAALGLQVHITELDVSLPVHSNGTATAENLQRQADVYRSVVSVCAENPNCTALQFWGFTDKWSWIGSHSHHTRGAALPFDQHYQPKPAYAAIEQEVARATKRH